MKTKKSRFWHLKRELRTNYALFLMALPAVVILIVNNYMPMFGLFIAFKKIDYAKGLWKSDWVGFRNFQFFLDSPDRNRVILHTIGYNLAFIFSTLAVSIAIAVFLNELRNKRAGKFYQTVYFFPYFLSWVVASYIGMALFNESGFLNTVVLKALGLEKVTWYMQANAWYLILPIVNLWKGLGYNSVVYLASIAGIDRELHEAAVIDGANKRRQIFKITLPMLKPVVIMLTVLAIGKVFYSDFGLFYQFTRGGGGGVLFKTVDVLDTYVFRTLRTMNNIGMSSAAGFFQSIVGFAFLLCANLAVRKISREDALF
jgi:putative aldouronate transport system permease protein